MLHIMMLMLMLMMIVMVLLDWMHGWMDGWIGSRYPARLLRWHQVPICAVQSLLARIRSLLLVLLE